MSLPNCSTYLTGTAVPKWPNAHPDRHAGRARISMRQLCKGLSLRHARGSAVRLRSPTLCTPGSHSTTSLRRCRRHQTSRPVSVHSVRTVHRLLYTPSFSWKLKRFGMSDTSVAWKRPQRKWRNQKTYHRVAFHKIKIKPDQIRS